MKKTRFKDKVLKRFTPGQKVKLQWFPSEGEVVGYNEVERFVIIRSKKGWKWSVKEEGDKLFSGIKVLDTDKLWYVSLEGIKEA